MATTLQAVRGMHDILPPQSRYFVHLVQTAREVLGAYGYDEIRLPMVESTELFKRTIGDVTDIVEKEMYTFVDRNGDSLSLRPEGTAGCVRAGIEQGLLHNQVQRLWYAGAMFRHERLQKGRYRQFLLIGVDSFGLAGPDIDAELLLLTQRLWRRLGLEGLVLQLNSLGTPAVRAAYREQLVAYFSAHRDALDDDSRRRLESNPLRILDSKSPDMTALIAAAPTLRAAGHGRRGLSRQSAPGARTRLLHQDRVRMGERSPGRTRHGMRGRPLRRPGRAARRPRDAGGRLRARHRTAGEPHGRGRHSFARRRAACVSGDCGRRGGTSGRGLGRAIARCLSAVAAHGQLRRRQLQDADEARRQERRRVCAGAGR